MPHMDPSFMAMNVMSPVGGGLQQTNMKTTEGEGWHKSVSHRNPSDRGLSNKPPPSGNKRAPTVSSNLALLTAN